MAKEETLVLGTRDFNLEHVPFKSRKGNKITTFVFKLSSANSIATFIYSFIKTPYLTYKTIISLNKI